MIAPAPRAPPHTRRRPQGETTNKGRTKPERRRTKRLQAETTQSSQPAMVAMLHHPQRKPEQSSRTTAQNHLKRVTIQNVRQRFGRPLHRAHHLRQPRPVRPSFRSEGMAPEVAASRAPSASTVSIHAALDEPADLGAASVGFRAAELSAALRCTGCFFLCARAGGVACGVACS